MIPRAARFRRALLAWYRANRRDLPWRRTTDPWAVLVSETMLQQTRSETVVRYYGRFLARFPDPASLARAREPAVLAAWAGLGYYRRARNLHAAAKAIVELHGGRVPRDPAALADLPGVGRYTLGAVGSIAFDLPLPLVDGNVERVLARWFELGGDLRSAGGSRRVWQIAQGLVPARGAGDWNQAVMELGATVCAPRSPECPRCPVARLCEAHLAGTIDRYPAKQGRPEMVRTREATAVIEQGGRILLVPRPPGGRMAGLWETPTIEVANDPREELTVELARLGLAVLRLEPIGSFRHTILQRAIEKAVFRAELAHVPADVRAGARWFRRQRLSELPLSAAGIRVREMIRRARTRGDASSTPRRPAAAAARRARTRAPRRPPASPGPGVPRPGPVCRLGRRRSRLQGRHRNPV